MKLIGDVVPVDKVEVVKKVRENLMKEYHLSAIELAAKFVSSILRASHNRVWKALQENGVKDNPDYSAYNFRNKKQEDKYRESGDLPSAIP